MNIRHLAINTILLLALAAAGCKSSEQRRTDKQVTVLRFHWSASSAVREGVETIYLPRQNPMALNIQGEALLDQGEILRAAVIDTPYGGHAIRLQFTQRGTFVLDTLSTGNRGRQLAIHALFDNESRWLGAPLMRERITNGILTFTPDATREEADRIVLGINNVAAKLHKPKGF